MIYEWQCKKCGAKVEVQRSLKDYMIPPTKEEGLHQIPETAKDSPHWPGEPGDWERVISVAAVPFQHLRQAGVFADDNGNFAPRKI